MTNATLYDSTQPLECPHESAYMAIYSNGRYKADRAAVQAAYPDTTIWNIDVLGNNPSGASIFDIEKYDGQPDQVLSWVPDRLDAVPNSPARLYCNISTWPSVRLYVARLSPQDREWVRYWIANPTGRPHIVPGAEATQWDWLTLYDISEITSSFIS